MAYKIVGLFALLIVGLGAFFIYRAAKPSYATARFSDPSLELEYPASWEAPKFRPEPGLRYLRLAPSEQTPFNTRWDREDTTFWIVEMPAAKVGDLKQYLLNAAAEARLGHPSLVPANLAVQPVKLEGGLEAQAISWPTAHEVLDIGEPKEGLLQALYTALMVRKPTWHHLVFVGKNEKAYEIVYLLPGDRLARWRYGTVYDRILRSIRIH